MIANTRKMYEFKLKVQELLEIEDNVFRCVDALVELGRFNLENLQELRRILKCNDFLEESITLISKEEIMKNPYLRDIKISQLVVDKFCLSNQRIVKSGNINFSNSNFRTDDLYPIREFCYFDKTLHLPAIAETKTAISWMTVEPFEINTFAEFAENAEGNILLGGCGLGYIAYILSLKDSVNEITIVDNNTSIIELFKKHILPQFKNKDKIKIVQDDILEYMHNTDLSEYDEINLDVWREYLDMIYVYLPALEIEFAHPEIKFSYWIEENLRYAIGTSLMRVFVNISDDNNIFDIIARDILENSDIKTPEDFKALVKLDDMRNILYHWYLDNRELTSKFEERDMKRLDIFVKKSREFISKPTTLI